MTPDITPEEAHVRAVAVAMTALVDVRDWISIKRCFAPRVTVDYSSLWGGEAEEMTSDQLVGQWKSLVPGFDATRHALENVSVSIDGDKATGTAAITATHLIDGDAWIIAGDYRYSFVRTAGDWHIDTLTLLCKSERGDRALTETAKRRVSD
jgi:hypothetical protein